MILSKSAQNQLNFLMCLFFDKNELEYSRCNDANICEPNLIDLTISKGQAQAVITTTADYPNVKVSTFNYGVPTGATYPTFRKLWFVIVLLIVLLARYLNLATLTNFSQA